MARRERSAGTSSTPSTRAARWACPPSTSSRTAFRPTLGALGSGQAVTAVPKPSPYRQVVLGRGAEIPRRQGPSEQGAAAPPGGRDGRSRDARGFQGEELMGAPLQPLRAPEVHGHGPLSVRTADVVRPRPHREIRRLVAVEVPRGEGVKSRICHPTTTPSRPAPP